MQLVFTLCLPRDQASVPIVRHVCRDCLLKLGVDAECVSDIELAVTEACTNVLDHAEGTGDNYEVRVEVDEHQSKISVIDTGEGFEAAPHRFNQADSGAEHGRGLFLMKALVDDLKFISAPAQGTIVQLVKALTLRPDSILSREVDRQALAAASE